ncbi:disintegrin and metalloproteinase domain-containing protein 33 isoform X4 [Pleurodeles waltl]|uniref:disintegrin and metalloproteinase domain-containing protein 33 isoform X4 n=1 Tax=Pleurodeles waltl TaxID=8319 RepID=UPI003709BE3F
MRALCLLALGVLCWPQLLSTVEAITCSMDRTRNFPKLGLPAHPIIQQTSDGTLKTLTKMQYEDQIQHKVYIGGRSHVLHLKKAQELLTRDFTESHYLEDGTLITQPRHHKDHCCYTGYVEGIADSFVSVCTCQGLGGYVMLREETYTIDTYSSEDSQEKVFNLAFRRSETHTHDGSKRKLLSAGQSSDVIFSKINFQIFLVGLEIWSQENKVNISDTAPSTLKTFLQWRKTELLPRKHHDNIQLISGVDFKNYALGEAFVSKMCTPHQSGGVVKDSGVRATDLAKYVAHEMGHNLGMIHDTRECHCPVSYGHCLLSKHTGHNMKAVFSDCSHRFLTIFLQEKNVTCLKDRPKTYIDVYPPSEEHANILPIVGVISLHLSVLLLLTLIAWVIWKRRRTSQKAEFSTMFNRRSTFSSIQSWEDWSGAAV